jgi:hypothetical protein
MSDAGYSSMHVRQILAHVSDRRGFVPALEIDFAGVTQ